MKIAYINWSPTGKTRALLEHAESIIAEYEAAGYLLTLRQLYYQFVARDIIPNTERSYKNLGTIITKARMSGLISWHAIEDRNRSHNDFWYEEDIMEPIMKLPNYIRFDKWARQDYYVEVWVEKEALGNVIAKACDPWLVPYMACKGYLSASELWRAGQRFADKIEEGKECVLIHLGDHDPSGMDMTRDNADRLNLFTGYEEPLVDVQRVALNMDQVKKYKPPPNPAKLTDTRAGKYIKQYGKVSWELDALEPQVMVDTIQTSFKDLIDFKRWEEVQKEQDEERNKLKEIYNNWDKIETLIKTGEYRER